MGTDDGSWAGKTLASRYTLTRRIGSGGMSTVYEAADEQLGRTVALKIFNPGEARDDSRRRSEVDVLARLNHPHLVTMYDAHLSSGDESVPSFLVLELVNGPDLRSTLDHGPLRGAIAAQIATDIAQGLTAMHAQGIVHRDLKPANILLSPTGLPSPTHRAKLADFGIAHLVGADRMTTVGTIIGTASYLSPEQAAGADPGPEADVYALGLVVLEGLTGHREYPGTIVEAMSARASRDPVVGDGIPASWVSLLTQMTARDPAARPTAREVAIRSQDIAPDLAEWDSAPVDRADEATAPLLAPTVRMTAPNPALPAVEVAPSSPSRSLRGARIVLVSTAAAGLVAGGIWLGGTLLQTTSTSLPVPAPALTDVPSTAAPVTDSPATPAAQTSSDPTPAAEVPTAEPVPVEPAAPTAPSAPAASTAPEAPSTSPGNSGNSNGNNGNGNGNGNNGNGNGNNGNGNGNNGKG